MKGIKYKGELNQKRGKYNKHTITNHKIKVVEGTNLAEIVKRHVNVISNQISNRQN